MTVLILTVTILAVVVSVGAIWMAIWSWSTFRVSILIWLVAGRMLGAASSLLTYVPDRAKLESAIKTLQTQSNLEPADLLVSTAYLTKLFPTLATLGFLLIALGELSHFGRRIVPSYEPAWVLLLVYRMRHLFGVLAVICTLVPSTALYIWFRSMP